MSEQWMRTGAAESRQRDGREAVAEMPFDETATLRERTSHSAAPPEAADHTGTLVRWPHRKPRHRRDGRRRLRRIITVLVLLAVVVGSGPLINSPIGAKGADLLRAVLGPRLTAQVESYYFGATDTLARLRARVFHTHGAAPWAVAHTATLPAGSAPEPGASGRPNPAHLMPLPPVKTIIAPALTDEGVWISSGLPAPGNRGWPVPMAKTYLRPDPDRPYAVVMLVAIDLRQAALHLVDGTAEPASGGPGVIPANDQSSGALLAAFNGGFKAADGHYGLMINGHTYLPPQPRAATLALYDVGMVRIGEWGTDAIPTEGLVAFRQNGAPLIVNGVVNPTAASDGWSWGATILANIYTWRSALALTRDGVLLYAAGNAVSASTLARALVAAGAEQAMELDINPVWVRCMTYQNEHAALTARKLRDDMYGNANQFLVPYERDFIYVTRLAPPWPVNETSPTQPH